VLLFFFIHSIGQLSIDHKFRLHRGWFDMLLLDGQLPPLKEIMPDELTAVLSIKHSGHGIEQVLVFMEILLFLDEVQLEIVSGILVFKHLTSLYVLNQLFKHTSLVLHIVTGILLSLKFFLV